MVAATYKRNAELIGTPYARRIGTNWQAASSEAYNRTSIASPVISGDIGAIVSRNVSSVSATVDYTPQPSTATQPAKTTSCGLDLTKTLRFTRNASGEMVAERA